MWILIRWLRQKTSDLDLQLFKNRQISAEQDNDLNITEKKMRTDARRLFASPRQVCYITILAEKVLFPVKLISFFCQDLMNSEASCTYQLSGNIVLFYSGILGSDCNFFSCNNKI